MSVSVDFFNQLKELLDEFTEFQLKETYQDRPPYEYDILGFSEWLEFNYDPDKLLLDNQQDLIDFVTDPETIKRAVEGSMEKRQALIDRVDPGNIKQPKGDSNAQ